MAIDSGPTLRVSDSAALRPLEPGDADELYGLIEADRPRLARWMPWAQAQTRAGTLEFIRSARAQPERDGGFQLALVVDRRLAGVFGIHKVDIENRTTSIGYWLAARHEGAGLATFAARALVGHAFDAMGMHRVEIRAAPDNVRSRAIPERLGFSQEAVLRDAERFGDEYRDNILYAMLAPDWAARRS